MTTKIYPFSRLSDKAQIEALYNMAMGEGQDVWDAFYDVLYNDIGYAFGWEADYVANFEYEGQYNVYAYGDFYYKDFIDRIDGFSKAEQQELKEMVGDDYFTINKYQVNKWFKWKGEHVCQEVRDYFDENDMDYNSRLLDLFEQKIEEYADNVCAEIVSSIDYWAEIEYRASNSFFDEFGEFVCYKDDYFYGYSDKGVYKLAYDVE